MDFDSYKHNNLVLQTTWLTPGNRWQNNMYTNELQKSLIFRPQTFYFCLLEFEVFGK